MSINAFLARGFNPGAGQLAAEKAKYQMGVDEEIRNRNAFVQDRAHNFARERFDYQVGRNAKADEVAASNASAAQKQAEADHERWVMEQIQGAQTPEQAKAIYEWGLMDAQKRGFDVSDAPSWEQIQGTYVPPKEKPQSYGNTTFEVALPDGTRAYAQPGGPDGYRVLEGVSPPGPTAAEQARERAAVAQAEAAELEVEESRQQRAAAQRGKEEAAAIAESLMQDPDFESVYGSIQGLLPSGRSGVIDAEAKVDQLVNMLTLENTTKMTGVLSESDIQILANAGTILANKRISDKAARTELKKIFDVFKRAADPSYDPTEGATEGGGYSSEQVQSLVDKYAN